jgi:hypothetical protein
MEKKMAGYDAGNKKGDRRTNPAALFGNLDAYSGQMECETFPQNGNACQFKKCIGRFR